MVTEPRIDWRSDLQGWTLTMQRIVQKDMNSQSCMTLLRPSGTLLVGGSPRLSKAGGGQPPLQGHAGQRLYGRDFFMRTPRCQCNLRPSPDNINRTESRFRFLSQRALFNIAAAPGKLIAPNIEGAPSNKHPNKKTSRSVLSGHVRMLSISTSPVQLWLCA